ncbi:hypothetical protein CDD82_6745 [Ophiocordyceps australis]|uniref:ABC transporter domain-containing protein n=1 Tax=Ophiocordyceps australis TaxID=1399860 RepID=A0A2C5ZM98_9HYPO|nr:hypothetical protein CDD82_6745 [Ophiocordyceps australis]
MEGNGGGPRRDSSRRSQQPAQRGREEEEVYSSSSSTDKAQEERLQRQTSNAMIESTDRDELVRIATALSQRRSNVSITQHPSQRQPTLEEIGENDASLNPESPDFDLHRWLQRFMGQLQEQGMADHKTGVVFRQLDVLGSGSALQLQHTVGSALMAPLRVGELFSFGNKHPKHILHGFEGLVKSGELLVVLGRPGSGCSTLLKTLCGQLHGLKLGQHCSVHYNGIPLKQMQREFRGEAVYNQEVDKHFPHLTVGQTLEFAASARTPSHRIQNMSRREYCRYLAQVVMSICGLSHTYNTKVGNDFVRGVSGGERKRVSIAEMIVAGSPLSAWDNR